MTNVSQELCPRCVPVCLVQTPWRCWFVCVGSSDGVAGFGALGVLQEVGGAPGRQQLGAERCRVGTGGLEKSCPQLLVRFGESKHVSRDLGGSCSGDGGEAGSERSGVGSRVRIVVEIAHALKG